MHLSVSRHAARLVLALALPIAALAASPAPLTLEEALRLAEARSTQLEAQRAAAEASASLAIAAGENPDPRLILGIENAPIEGKDAWSLTADGATRRRIGVVQDFIRDEKRELMSARAEANARREEALVRTQTVEVRREVAVAWFERLYAERSLALVDALASEIELQMSTTAAHLAAGMMASAEPIAARASRARLADRRLEVERLARRAQAKLARWLGEDAKRVPVGEPDLASLPASIAALTTNVENHPQLAMFAPLTAAAEADARLAAIATKPNYSVELSYGARGSAYTDGVTLLFRMDLPVFASTRQEPAAIAKRKQAEQALALAEEARRTYESNVRAALVDYEIARDRLDRNEREIVPLAEERTRATLAAYEGGRTNLDVVLESRRALLEARLAALAVRTELARAWAALLAAGGYGGYWYAHRAMHAAPAAGATDAKADAGRKVLYWHDPMYPAQKFDKPGRSPFMDMDLMPVYADDGADAGGVKVSPRVVQNLGVRTAVAEKGRLALTVEAVGAIAFDERAVTLVQSRTPGYVEKLFARAPLDPVRKGQPLAELFVPEWAGAQEEFLALKKSTAPGAQELARAARNRLLLLNMTEEQVADVERAGKPRPHVTLASPMDGVVGELVAREGMTVMPGAMLFRINGLATVWVNVDIPEAQAAAVVPGAPITATVPAYPGEKFAGRINAVLPDVAAASRTLRARVELANPGARLKPGMYVTLAIAPASSREAVLVPSEAVIPTGRRTVIVVDRGESRFEPVEVETGREQGGRMEILKGLDAGTRVVVSGQFLIDSEASLKATTTRMGDAPEGREYQADAKLEKFGKDTWTITHGPVPELKWGAMTMEFIPMKEGVPPGARPGQEVRLSFTLDKDGMPVVTKIAPKGAAK